MILRAVFALSILLSLPSLSIAESCKKPKNLMDRAVVIEQYSRGRGSGVWFDSNTIITSNHVINDIEMPWVWLPTARKSVQAEVVYGTDFPDIAILKITPPKGMKKLKPLEVSQKPSIDIFLSSYAFAQKHRGAVTPALFQKMVKLKMEKTANYIFAIMDDWAFAGDSGGGMYTCDGKLTGIQRGNYASNGRPKHIIAVNGKSIQKALHKAKK